MNFENINFGLQLAETKQTEMNIQVLWEGRENYDW